MATTNVPATKPRRYAWPAEAASIAERKQHPVRLCEELMALTGHDKAACWRFLKKHGVNRPGSATRHTFDTKKVETIIEYISEHGMHAASQRFHCEAKTLYNLVHRRGYTHCSKDPHRKADVFDPLRRPAEILQGESRPSHYAPLVTEPDAVP